MGWNPISEIGDAVGDVGDIAGDVASTVRDEVGDAASTLGGDLVDAAGWVRDGAVSAGHWLADNWETIAATLASMAAYFAVVTVAALVVAALAITLPVWGTVAVLIAAGFASGVAFYAVSQWLNGRPVDGRDLLIQGALGSVLSVATLGLGRAIAPALSSGTRPAVHTVQGWAVETVAGGVFGGGLEVAANAIQGEPLSDGVVDAAALGLIEGGLTGPADNHLSGVNRGTSTPTRAVDETVDPTTSVAPPPVSRWPSSEPLVFAAPTLDLSPTTKAHLDAILADGWQVVTGRPGDGSYARPDLDGHGGVIVIDPKTPENFVAAVIAHEVGHAYTVVPPVSARGLTRDEYVLENTRRALEWEALAVLENVTAHMEVKATNGAGVGVLGQNAAEYERIALDPHLTREQKVDEIARLMAQEVPSVKKPDGTPYASYDDYYSSQYGRHWDAMQTGGTAGPSIVWPIPEPGAGHAPSKTKGLLGALGR